MRNSRLDRILYIQQVLVQGGVLNKQQTADRFGVSEKTIQRDLDTLRNHFADSEPRREILYNSAKGGYLLDDTLSRFLTSSEILAVCKILLESRSMVKEEMFPILDKLIWACTPLDRLNQIKDLISNERFHYVEPQHGRKFIESLWEIGTAVENHNVMEITYCRTHDGETRVRTIEPVGILFSEYYFYLAAFIEGIDKDKHFQNPQDNSPTIYRIDRIQNLRLSIGILPSGIPTAFRRARCASASSSCTAASCRPSGSSIPGQVWNLCWTDCRRRKSCR